MPLPGPHMTQLGTNVTWQIHMHNFHASYGHIAQMVWLTQPHYVLAAHHIVSLFNTIFTSFSQFKLDITRIKLLRVVEEINTGSILWFLLVILFS